MIVFRTVAPVRQLVRAWRARRSVIGLVPTMGALHEGHLALIRRSKRLCDRTVVSVFVNPTQFAPGEDFGKYPRTWAADRHACMTEGVDLVFAPQVRAIYSAGKQVSVGAGQLGAVWEGASRPGHFDGVATVVAKLFNIVGPDVAVFGQKDYQQSIIIRRMADDLDFPVRIVVAPTVREPGGLAKSSRNIYLDAATRADAQSIYRSLRWAAREIRAGRRRSGQLIKSMKSQMESGRKFKVDYAAVCDPQSLVSLSTARPPVVILVAAECVVKGLAYGRRYIDNILIR